MADLTPIFDLVSGLCGTADDEVYRAVRDTQQRILAGRAARGTIMSTATLFEVASALEKLIEGREEELLAATTKAVKSSPPGAAKDTHAALLDFVMADLARYYGRGAMEIAATQKSVGYIDGLPPDISEHQQRLRRRVSAALTILLATATADRVAAPVATAAPIKQSPSSMDIFISHSSEDKELAEAFVAMLLRALPLDPARVRCTSVDGHGLPLGADTEEQIIKEVQETRVLIGLVTPASLKSGYFLFELGARWGAKLFLGPVLAKGATAKSLPGPISGRNALHADNEAQMHKLLEDISAQLQVSPHSPATYLKDLKAFVELSRTARLLQELRGCRVKSKTSPEQFYVADAVHYLDQGAAGLCDRSGLGLTALESQDIVLMIKHRGADLNAETMKTMLGTSAPPQGRGLGRLPAEQERILAILWGSEDETERSLSRSLSISTGSMSYHLGELYERRLVLTSADSDDDSVTITREGRRYVADNGLVDATK